jgi:hypothetical protein
VSGEQKYDDYPGGYGYEPEEKAPRELVNEYFSDEEEGFKYDEDLEASNAKAAAELKWRGENNAWYDSGAKDKDGGGMSGGHVKNKKGPQPFLHPNKQKDIDDYDEEIKPTGKSPHQSKWKSQRNIKKHEAKPKKTNNGYDIL